MAFQCYWEYFLRKKFPIFVVVFYYISLLLQDVLIKNLQNTKYDISWWRYENSLFNLLLLRLSSSFFQWSVRLESGEGFWRRWDWWARPISTRPSSGEKLPENWKKWRKSWRSREISEGKKELCFELEEEKNDKNKNISGCSPLISDNESERGSCFYKIKNWPNKAIICCCSKVTKFHSTLQRAMV